MFFHEPSSGIYVSLSKFVRFLVSKAMNNDKPTPAIATLAKVAEKTHLKNFEFP